MTPAARCSTPSRLYYSGGSQGGIAGGALTAVAPDFTRSVLIVPAMNYSLLLTRSIDFDPFRSILYPAYPDELERPLLLSLIQTLWDRGEPNGYAWHMTDDPYPNTPAHTVLLHMAYGDHQVANVGTEVEARTIGAKLRRPALDPGRSTDVDPFYAIEPIRRYPYRGSALVVWDIGPLRPAGCGAAGAPACIGTGQPPITNTAPRLGVDPHGVTGREPSASGSVLPVHRRRADRRLRRRAVPRGRLDGAVKTRATVLALAVLALLAPGASAHWGRVEAPPITPGLRSARHGALPASRGRTTTSPSRPGRPPGGGSTCCPRPRRATRAACRSSRPTTTSRTASAPDRRSWSRSPASTRPRRSRRPAPVPVTDLARAYDRRAPIVVINARTHRRHLIWAEIDSNGVTPETTRRC